MFEKVMVLAYTNYLDVFDVEGRISVFKLQHFDCSLYNEGYLET